MTGYGESEISHKDLRISVEIRSVNHRFLDFSIKIPKSMNSKEREIREIIKNRISRGRVSVTISVNGIESDYDVRLDTDLMEKYLEELRRFAAKHKLSPEIAVDTLASLPDVFVKSERKSLTEKQWASARKALVQALDACVAMRSREGKALEKDIRRRLAAMNKLTTRIEKVAPRALEANKKALRARLEKLMEGASLDNERWMTEVSMLADRMDFTEELIRLKSHLAQFKSCVDAGGVVSKKLTYILQEIHREVTTLGTKASSTDIIEMTVLLKEEAEKLREQVQNLE
jgi:uncharacterized protein (TIGR00255 family)